MDSKQVLELVKPSITQSMRDKIYESIVLRQLAARNEKEDVVAMFLSGASTEQKNALGTPFFSPLVSPKITNQGS